MRQGVASTVPVPRMRSLRTALEPFGLGRNSGSVPLCALIVDARGGVGHVAQRHDLRGHAGSARSNEVRGIGTRGSTRSTSCSIPATSGRTSPAWGGGDVPVRGADPAWPRRPSRQVAPGSIAVRRVGEGATVGRGPGTLLRISLTVLQARGARRGAGVSARARRRHHTPTAQPANRNNERGMLALVAFCVEGAAVVSNQYLLASVTSRSAGHATRVAPSP
jgi:hypothetical protein